MGIYSREEGWRLPEDIDAKRAKWEIGREKKGAQRRA